MCELMRVGTAAPRERERERLREEENLRGLVRKIERGF